jgi:hypothetical protein
MEYTTKDINGNGLIRISENIYESTTTGNKYEYNGFELVLIEEGNGYKGEGYVKEN